MLKDQFLVLSFHPNHEGMEVKLALNVISKYFSMIRKDSVAIIATYETIAKKHDVTRARICQMIALAKKLPSEISDLFIDSKNSDKLRHITERKLRPITLMKSDEN